MHAGTWTGFCRELQCLKFNADTLPERFILTRESNHFAVTILFQRKDYCSFTPLMYATQEWKKKNTSNTFSWEGHITYSNSIFIINIMIDS